MSTEAQLKALSNSELASGIQIPALNHRTVNNAIIEEMYDAQSRGDVLSGVQSAGSLASGDQVFVIRSGQAYLLDASNLDFVSALSDLTDVSITSLSNDQILVYDTSVSRWVNKFIDEIIIGGTITGTGTVNTIPKFTDLKEIGDSSITDDGTNVTVDAVLRTAQIEGVSVAAQSQKIFFTDDSIILQVGESPNLTIGAGGQFIVATGAGFNGTVTAGSFVTDGGTSSDFVKGDGSLDGTTYQDTSEKGQANGYTPLDSGAKVAEAYLPDSILGQVSYQGTWDASTNTPTLANPPASTTKGEYYVTSVAGTQFSIDFQVGDWIISNGTSWEKVDNTDAVTSVFGRLGNIVANESDYSSFYPLVGTTISAGSGLTGGGDLSANRTISHADTSSQSSVDNSGGAVIQDIALDEFGHVAALGSVNLDARYIQSETDTLDSVTDRGATTTNAITVGGATINGNLTVDTNSLFVDSANNRVGIGTSSPTQRIDVNGNIKLLSDGFTPAQIPQSSIGLANDGYVYLRGGSGGLIIGDTDNSTAFVARETEIAQIFTNGSERMRIDSSGNVGIGTSTINNVKFAVNQTADQQGIALGASFRGSSRILWEMQGVTNEAHAFVHDNGTNRYTMWSSGRDNNIFYTNNTERMRITSSGNVGIGNVGSNAKLEVSATSGEVFRADASGGAYRIVANQSGVNLNGNVGIGTGSPYNNLTVEGASARMDLNNAGGASRKALLIEPLGYGGNAYARIESYDYGLGSGGDLVINSQGGNVGIGTSSPSATLDINGSLSKNSGSFKIDHPLPEKKDTHHLVHSFVEAPQADNIYRGQVDLVDGKATVNLDEAGRMTEGTFVLLNTNIQTFTSNESDWDAVRGKVEGNILTIECQNPESTATVNWLVIGERHDQHMMETEWTDENGRVITEPLKPIVEDIQESTEE